MKGLGRANGGHFQRPEVGLKGSWTVITALGSATYATTSLPDPLQIPPIDDVVDGRPLGTLGHNKEAGAFATVRPWCSHGPLFLRVYVAPQMLALVLNHQEAPVPQFDNKVRIKPVGCGLKPK